MATIQWRCAVNAPMMNAVELAIQAYAPCLSCAPHAIGQMPLEITLHDSAGAVLDQRRKNI